jgi:hypothetical protein
MIQVTEQAAKEKDVNGLCPNFVTAEKITVVSFILDMKSIYDSNCQIKWEKIFRTLTI